MNWLSSRTTILPQPISSITLAMFASQGDADASTSTHHPSPKRRKLEQNREMSSVSPQWPSVTSERSESEATLTEDVRIKKERSPSPQLDNSPRLVTSGSKHIFPIPQSCLRSEKGHLEARKEWARQEVLKLRRLGIKHEKILVREDGMVIDWISPVPVWSDTLLPAGQREYDVDMNVPEQSEISIPPSTTSAGVNGLNVNRTQPPLQSTASGLSHDDPINLVDQQEAMPGDDDTKKHCVTPLTTNEASKNEYITIIRPLEELALDFFRRYIHAFDNDRTALKCAYSSSAQFSYKIHDILSPESVAAAFLPKSEVERFASRKGDRNLLNSTSDISGHLQLGSDEISSTLKSFGPYKLSPTGYEVIDYDVIYINPPQRVVLTCYGHFVDTERNHSLSFDQAFVLQKKEDFESDRHDVGLWPMVAISHQLTVRDLKSRPRVEGRATNVS